MKGQKAYLLHIRDSIAQIRKYTRSGKHAFFRDRKTQDAVIRNIEIIGEATKNLSTEIKSKHPEIPWKQIAGMRDKVVHDYFGIDLELVWETIRTKLSELDGCVQIILRQIRD